jgi:predicted O-linked N-acetylglucosamine transferase (SPINDLY family)
MSDPRLQAALQSHQVGNLAEASRLYEEVLRSDPENGAALYLLGYVHLQGGDFARAERLMGEALKVNPRALDALYNRGRALLELKRDADALDCFDAMLALNPNIHEALFQRAYVWAEKRRFEEALADYDKVVALAPQLTEAWNNRANVLAALGRLEDAMSSYDRARSLNPADMRTLNHRATTLFELKRYEEAEREYAAVLEADPEFPYAKGNRLYSKLYGCDWLGLEEQTAAAIEDLRAGRHVLTPIQAAAIVSSADDQLRCSRLWSADRHPPVPEPLWRGERYRHDRIRLAYLSADLHTHAVSVLIAGVFEAHDRARFETIALSFGPNDRSHMRSRLEGSFERFLDVRNRSDLEIGRMLKEMEVDITVDLSGYTQNCRPGILALRPVPVQVHYLGFPGTLGASFIDYILGDRIVIPAEEQASAYAEKIVTLPETYQCNDRARLISPATPRRADVGLPEEGFVFCSFNNSFKIRLEIFDLWMRLLRQVAGSVLWLLEDNAAAVRNLRREAEKRGVAADRLVFAPRESPHLHLARHRLAGLVLDTLPYGSHTTASDALWAGVPVLTCMGSTFAGRVAASLLHAVGLPEMITHTLDDYEALALKLARDPGALSAIAQKLGDNRDSCPLFDTGRITRHLEAAYTVMWERSQRGETPESFTVPALP